MLGKHSTKLHTYFALFLGAFGFVLIVLKQPWTVVPIYKMDPRHGTWDYCELRLSTPCVCCAVCVWGVGEEKARVREDRERFLTIPIF